MTDAPDLPAFDAPALIAKIRAGDPDALREAYQMTFGSDLGRLVLAHHLHECGVGSPLGRENLKYLAGRHDAAIDLAAKAAFDAPAIAVAVLTDTLEGASYDGPSYGVDRDPDIELDD